MKTKFLIYLYDSLGYIFCEIAFRGWVLLEYWHSYRIGEEYDMDCWQQKVCEWFYDIGRDFYQKGTDLNK